MNFPPTKDNVNVTWLSKSKVSLLLGMVLFG